MKYILLTVFLITLSNIVFGAGHNHGTGIVESCLNDGFQELVYDDKDLIEEGQTYYTAKGSVSCHVDGLQMMAARKAKLISGDCVLTQISENKVEMKYTYDYKIHSSIDLSQAPSIFDDAAECFIESLR